MAPLLYLKGTQSCPGGCNGDIALPWEVCGGYIPTLNGQRETQVHPSSLRGLPYLQFCECLTHLPLPPRSLWMARLWPCLWLWAMYG